MTSRRIRKLRPTAASILRERRRWEALAEAARDRDSVEIQPLIALKDDHAGSRCCVCGTCGCDHRGESHLVGDCPCWAVDTLDQAADAMEWSPEQAFEHQPMWEPAQLPINAAGDTRPGFVCVHPLGHGTCGSNVFSLEDAAGVHWCVVDGGDPGPLFGTSVRA